MYTIAIPIVSEYSDLAIRKRHVEVEKVIQKFICNDLQNTMSDSGMLKMLDKRVLSVSFCRPESGEDDRCRILPELICGPSIIQEQEMLRLQYALDDLTTKHPFITDQVLFGLHELYCAPKTDVTIMIKSAWLCGALQCSFEDLSIIAHLKARVMQIAHSLYGVNRLVLADKFVQFFEACNCLTSIQKPTPEYMTLGLDAVVSITSVFQRNDRTFAALPLYWRMRFDEVVVHTRSIHAPYCSHFLYKTPGYQNSDTKNCCFKFDMGVDDIHTQSVILDPAINPPDWWLYATWSYFKRLVDCGVSLELAERKFAFPEEMKLTTKRNVLCDLVFMLDEYRFDLSELPFLQELQFNELIAKSYFVDGAMTTRVGIESPSGVPGPTGESPK